jgi:hypothetical protein
MARARFDADSIYAAAAAKIRQRMTDQARLSWAILVSILLHALVLMSVAILRNVRLTLPATPPPIEVDLTQLPPLQARPPAPAQSEPAPPAPPPVLMPERQIVSPPDAGKEEPPAETRFLSDRDNVVEQESVRRGNGAAAPAEVAAPEDEPPQVAEPEEKPAQAAVEPKPPKVEAPASRRAPPPIAAPRQQRQTEIASLPKLDQLLPQPGEFARARPTPPSARSQAAANRNLLPGRRQVFAVSPGVSDFLPTIREGDITLLNTKAERFAPFVRRVAARVFQHLEIQLKRAARRGGNSSAGREYATVEAIMSKQGELVRARLVERETNTQLAVYKELLTAARPEVFFDANPPSGAEAADGNIHFILLVDLQVQVGSDPQTGRASTGYYGMAGVGLDVEPKE